MLLKSSSSSMVIPPIHPVMRSLTRYFYFLLAARIDNVLTILLQAMHFDDDASVRDTRTDPGAVREASPEAPKRRSTLDHFKVCLYSFSFSCSC